MLNDYSLVQSPLDWNDKTITFTNSDHTKDFFKAVSIMEWDIQNDRVITIKSNLPTVYSLTQNKSNQIAYSLDNMETENPSDKIVYMKDLNNKKSKVLLEKGYSLEWAPDGKKIGYIDDGIYI